MALSNSNPKNKKRSLNVVDQKNALQVLLQKYAGIIQVEKRFPWMKTPDTNKLPAEYKVVAKALKKYRGQDGFLRANYQLLCDIVLDDKKLILEYDENQHFSKARCITLENYPAGIKLSFTLNDWIKYCKQVDAHDNFPVDRDERRAFYDTVRDFESLNNGYKLVRIKHGETDWEHPNAVEELKKILKTNKI